MPQPAKEEGKAMDLAWKRRRMATSMTTRRVVEDIRWIVSAVADEGTDAAAAERHVLDRVEGRDEDAGEES